MKFGGTSVANLDKISNVADIVESEQGKHKIIVVLSAMAGTTNQTIKINPKRAFVDSKWKRSSYPS